MEIEIGVLPVLPTDVLDAIVQCSAPHDVIAIYMANKYWYHRLRDVFEDRVVVAARIDHVEEKWKYVFELHRGRVKEFRLDMELSFVDNYPCVPVNRISIGYFNTIGDMKCFIQQIRDTLKKQEDDFSDVHPSFECTVDLGSADSKVYYTVDHGADGILMDVYKGQRILELIKRADFVRRSALHKSDLQIKYEQYDKYKRVNYKNRIYITPHGDVFMKNNSSIGREEVTLKITTDLYAQLIEIIKYSKHKTDIIKSKTIRKNTIQSLFHAELTCDDTKYYVQDLMVYDNPSIFTNGYKTNAAKRIVQLLLTHLFPPKFEESMTLYVNRNIELPKPQSLIYELGRRVPYPTSLAPYMLVNNLGVSIEHSGAIKYIYMRLERHVKIPRKELIDLLKVIVAKGMQKDRKKIDYRMDQHVPGEKPIVMHIYLDPMYCAAYFMPKLEKSVVDRLWALLRAQGYLDFIYK